MKQRRYLRGSRYGKSPYPAFGEIPCPMYSYRQPKVAAVGIYGAEQYSRLDGYGGACPKRGIGVQYVRPAEQKGRYDYCRSRACRPFGYAVYDSAEETLFGCGRQQTIQEYPHQIPCRGECRYAVSAAEVHHGRCDGNKQKSRKQTFGCLWSGRMS